MFESAWRLFSPPTRRGVLVGDGAFQLRVVGTSYHQDLLEQIAGARTRAGYHRCCGALLVPQPSNRYDRHAVAVIIHDLEVAHLARPDALEFGDVLRASRFADVACEAEIVGGWLRSSDDWGYVGVRLNALMPFQVQSAEEYEVSRA